MVLFTCTLCALVCLVRLCKKCYMSHLAPVFICNMYSRELLCDAVPVSTCNVATCGNSAGPDPGFSVGGCGPILGGFGFQRGHLSVKMYAKMKELGPVGGPVLAPPPQISLCSGFAHLLLWTYVSVTLDSSGCQDPV